MTQRIRQWFGLGRKDTDRTAPPQPEPTPRATGRTSRGWFPAPGDPAWSRRLSKADRHFLLTPDVARPIPRISEAAYNDRAQWEKIMATRHNLLQKRVLAYLIEPDKQRLNEIEQAIEVLLEEPTWTPKWHKGAWDGEHILDIEAADVGVDLAMTLSLLRKELSPQLFATARSALTERITDPYWDASERAKAGNAPAWWSREDNWGAVIHAHASIATEVVTLTSGIRELGGADAGICRYLKGGFTPDGYCLEGPVYWNYGMQAVLSWYAILGRLNAGEFRPEFVELLRSRAAYGTRVASIDGIGPAFADSKSGDRIPATTCEVAAAYLGTPLPGWPRDRRFPSLAQAVAWLLRPKSASRVERPEDGLIYFGFGRLTRKNEDGDLLELFVQAHPNSDKLPHTHHDLGTWHLLKNGKPVAGDPGYPKEQSFGVRRYESLQNRAEGHPVPTLEGEVDQALGGHVSLHSRVDDKRLIMLSTDAVGSGVSWTREFRLTYRGLEIGDRTNGRNIRTRVCLPHGGRVPNIFFEGADVDDSKPLGVYKDGRRWFVVTSSPSQSIVTRVTC